MSASRLSSFDRPPLAPAQLRAARGLLGWSRRVLANLSGVSPETIKNIETGNFAPQESTVKTLCAVLAAYGVDFIDLPSAQAFGVMLTLPDASATKGSATP